MFRNQSKRASYVLSITIPVLVIVFFIAILAENHYHRTAQEKELTSINAALEYTLRPRLFGTDLERQACIDSLKIYDLQVKDIAEWDSIISLFVGKDSIMRGQIKRTSSVIEKQIKRYSILNKIDTRTYQVVQSKPADFRMIEPDNTVLPVLNVAFVIKEIPESATVALLSLCKGDTITYQQCYELQSGINAFLFPNKFNEGVELQVGYLTEENNTHTFHFKRYKPHV